MCYGSLINISSGLPKKLIFGRKFFANFSAKSPPGKSIPPPRPAASPSVKKPEIERKQETAQKEAANRARRIQIIEEIVETEKEFGKSLESVQESISKTKCALESFNAWELIGNIPQLVQLSKRFSINLECEQSKKLIKK